VLEQANIEYTMQNNDCQILMVKFDYSSSNKAS
jgi:hypothetical protein